MKKLLRLVIVVLLFTFVLWIGGYNWHTFARSIEVKSPDLVFPSLNEAIPNVNISNPTYQNDQTLPTITYDDQGHVGIDTNLNVNVDPSGVDASYGRHIIVSIGGYSVSFDSCTSLSFIKWVAQSTQNGEEIDVEVIEPTESTTEETSETTTEPTEPTPSPTPTVTINPVLIEDVELTYSTTLEDAAHLQVLVDDIEIVDELPDYDALVESGEWVAYDRDTYEKPVRSYMFGGIRINRNDYSWMTSPFLNADDFTFTCPYTGRVIVDLDDKKEDQDFGNLDYDHIVPLKSTYIRGAYYWTEEQRNAYAYDQWVGVDVLNSANRSKSDKGPLEYLPSINIEDYCYSWLLICSKYDLVMTQEEVDLCLMYINEALVNNEPVTHLGGYYEPS